MHPSKSPRQSPRRFVRIAGAAIAGIFGLLGARADGAFVDGTMVVVRVGDGSAIVTTVGQQVTLQTYDIQTGALLSSTPFQSAAGDADRFVLSGNPAVDEGKISLSADRRYLTLGGYRSTAQGANPVTSAVDRVVARVDGSMNINTTALANAYTGVAITAAVSTNGTEFWTVGGADTTTGNFTGGLRFVPSVGSGTNYNVSRTQSGANPDSYRNARMVGGKLVGYAASQGSFTNRGAYDLNIGGALPRTSSPTPATFATATAIITNTEGMRQDAGSNIDFDSGLSQQTNGKQYPKTDGIFLDLNNDGTRETAYTTGGKQEVEKWLFSTGKWTRTGTVFLQANPDVLSLDVYDKGASLDLLITTAAGIYKLDDNKTLGAGFTSGLLGASQTFTGQDNGGSPINASYQVFGSINPLFIPAGAYQFRGLAVVPEPGMLGLASIAVIGLAARRSRRA